MVSDIQGRTKDLFSYAGKFLHVNLTSGEIQEECLESEMARNFVGGKGFGAKILFERLKAGTNPFSPENLLMFLTGPLTGTLAPGNRYVIVFKSPLTETFCDTYAGGHFGQEIKFAGYDGIIIIGKAEEPVYLWIDDGHIEIREAKHLWGKKTSKTIEELKEKLDDESVRIACVGPAGENKVRFASVCSEPNRHAGRGGAGAVMGSKNLKAIAVRGTGEIQVANLDLFKEAVNEAYETLKEAASVQEYTSLGTPSGVVFASEEGFYPTKNFQDGHFIGAENLSGERQRDMFWLKDEACFACPIRCHKIGRIRKGKFAERIAQVVQYETTGLLGANCGIDNLEAVITANELCNELGLDTLSTGNVIGFAMECFERGIISKQETNGIEVRFGNYEALLELIRKISGKEGLGKILAEGVKRAAETIGKGSERFAVHVKGLESPAWGPRGSPGMGLALMTADRGGCHNRGWPISYELGAVWPGGRPLERLSLEGKPEVVKWEQDYLAAVFSLVECSYTTGMQAEIYVKLLHAATGWVLDTAELWKVGERIWNLIRLFNVREGFTRRNDDLPQRFKEGLPSGPAKGHCFTEKDINAMLNQYYALRGWDEEGKPKEEKIRELGLESYGKF